MTGAEVRAQDDGVAATTKLQESGLAFLFRLVAEYGPVEGAGILRAVAAEVEELAKWVESVNTPTRGYTVGAIKAAWQGVAQYPASL